MLRVIDTLKNKELLIALYFFLFIVGLSLGVSSRFYNEFRVLQILILIFFGVNQIYTKKVLVSKIDLYLFIFILFGLFYWSNYYYLLCDVILFYLIYKNIYIIQYNKFFTKFILYSSFYIFLLLPISIADYISSGTYYPIWYPMPWNIRIYDSYFLVLMMFATWFYIEDENKKYNFVNLIFIFIALLAVLLDGGRSVLLSFTIFCFVMGFYFNKVRYKLLSVYMASWLSYGIIICLMSLNQDDVYIKIARNTSGGRSELWLNAINSWVNNPIMGSGFYQLDKFNYLSAHPHNIFVQFLTETGLIGFVFLIIFFISFIIQIDRSSRKKYFALASMLAVLIDFSLSGSYIYPITQMIFLWLFVFLINKNNNIEIYNKNKREYGFLFWMSFVLLGCCIILYGGLFFNTNMLPADDKLVTPPRFWDYGYRMF